MNLPVAALNWHTYPLMPRHTIAIVATGRAERRPYGGVTENQYGATVALASRGRKGVPAQARGSVEPPQWSENGVSSRLVHAAAVLQFRPSSKYPHRSAPFLTFTHAKSLNLEFSPGLCCYKWTKFQPFTPVRKRSTRVCSFSRLRVCVLNRLLDIT